MLLAGLSGTPGSHTGVPSRNLDPARLRCPWLSRPACGWGGACHCRKWGCIQPSEGLKWHFWRGGGLQVPACCTMLPPRLCRRHSMLGAVVPAGVGVPNTFTKTPYALGHGSGSQGASRCSGCSLQRGLGMSHLPAIPARGEPLALCKDGGSATGALAALGDLCPGPGVHRECGLLPSSSLPTDDASPVPARMVAPTWEASSGLHQPSRAGGERDRGSGGVCLQTNVDLVF